MDTIYLVQLVQLALLAVQLVAHQVFVQFVLLKLQLHLKLIMLEYLVKL